MPRMSSSTECRSSEKRARTQQAEFQNLADAFMTTLADSEAPKKSKTDERWWYEDVAEGASRDVHAEDVHSDDYDEFGPPEPPVEPPKEPSGPPEEPSPVSAEEEPSASSAIPRPSRAPRLAEQVDEMVWYHTAQARPTSAPLRRSSTPWDEPPVMQSDIHRNNRYTPDEIAELRAESLVSTIVGARWQDRGPPRSEEDPNQTWRGQRWRTTGNAGFGRWGNRGGMAARWWSGYYHAKGNGKGALQTFLAANPKPQKEAT